MKNFCILVWCTGWLFTTGLNAHMFVRNEALTSTTFAFALLFNSVCWPIVLGTYVDTILYKED